MTTKKATTKVSPRTKLLQADTLGDLADGMLRKAIDKELEELFADVKARGHDAKTRTLTITVTVKPDRNFGENGILMIDGKATKKLPAREPHSTKAKVDMVAGAISFNPDNSDNPDQMTIGDALPDEG